jgi:hypothetical protein
MSKHDAIADSPIREQLDGVLDGHCSELADEPTHFGFHVIFDQRVGAWLRPKVVVAVVVADRETARQAVIQLVKAMLGVGNAVRGKHAPGLRLVSSTACFEEPWAGMAWLAIAAVLILSAAKLAMVRTIMARPGTRPSIRKRASIIAACAEYCFATTGSCRVPSQNQRR